MNASLFTWVVLSICVAGILWFAVPRKLALCIWIISNPLIFLGAMAPLGEPAFVQPPPGNYTVLGARIDVDKAIYVLLDSNLGGSPRYYVLPYTTGTANQLQDAIDASQGQQGGVEGEFGEGGEMAFHGPSVQEDRPKQPERPAYEVE